MLISSLILLLFTNALTVRREKSMLFSRLSIMGLGYCSLMTWNALHLQPLGKGMGMYGGLFTVTSLTQTFNIFMFLITSVILMLTAFYPSKVSMKQYSSMNNLLKFRFLYNKSAISNKAGEQFRMMEYALMILFVMCGGVFLMSTGDLISIFLSMELQSYGLYIICTLYRDSESATASGLTYFLLGGLSSCFILLGSAFLYSSSGTTNLDNLYVMTTISELFFWPYCVSQLYYFNLALIIMSVGFLFKVSAAPFHFWSPDVYDGMPTMVTAFVAIVAKMSMFIFILELVYYTDHDFFSFYWKTVLLMSSLLSLVMGSMLGITQFSMKSLLAYSTISHVGFILLALSMNSVESIQSFMFYLLQYSVSNLNAFLILLSMGFSFFLYVYQNKKEENKDNLSDSNNSPIQLISQMKGYLYINSFMSMSLSMTMFSFIGIPPMMGFFAKQMILSAALDNGYVFMSLVAMITSVVGAGYYLNVMKQMFFFKPDYKSNDSVDNIILTGYILPNKYYLNGKSQGIFVNFKPENMTINSGLSVSISMMTLMMMSFLFISEEWFNLMSVLSLLLFKA